MLHAADLRKTRTITNKPDVVRSRLSCGWSVSGEAAALLLSLPHFTWLFRGAVWGPRCLLPAPAVAGESAVVTCHQACPELSMHRPS